MKLAEVTWGVLLGLPVCLLIFLTNSTFVIVPNLRDEPVVHLPRLETTSKVHRSDLLGCKDAAQYIYGHPILEYYKDPVCGEVAIPALPAYFIMEPDWVTFKVSGGLFARSIVTAAVRV